MSKPENPKLFVAMPTAGAAERAANLLASAKSAQGEAMDEIQLRAAALSDDLAAYLRLPSDPVTTEICGGLRGQIDSALSRLAGIHGRPR